MNKKTIEKILDIDRMLLRENTNLKIMCKHLEDRIEKAIEEIEMWQPKLKILQQEKEYLLEILGDKE